MNIYKTRVHSDFQLKTENFSLISLTVDQALKDAHMDVAIPVLVVLMAPLALPGPDPSLETGHILHSSNAASCAYRK